MITEGTALLEKVLHFGDNSIKWRQVTIELGELSAKLKNHGFSYTEFTALSKNVSAVVTSFNTMEINVTHQFVEDNIAAAMQHYQQYQAEIAVIPKTFNILLNKF